MEPNGSPDEYPSVSVVIPAYNAALTIGRAIQSAYGQTYPRITEVVVVDDGSTDGTADVVAEDFPQVRLISQANGGPGRARNLGVELATGDYVGFLDADDEWVPHKTEVQMEAAARYPGAGAVGANTFGVPEGTSIPQERKERRLSRYTVQQRVYVPALRTFWISAVQAMLIPRDVFLAVGGFRDYRCGEDLDFGLRLLRLGYTMLFVVEPLTISYRHPDSTSGPVKARMEYAANSIAILRDLEPSDEPFPIPAPEDFSRIFRYHCRRSALWAMRWGYVRLGLSFLAEPPAVSAGPFDDALRVGTAAIGRLLRSWSGQEPRPADRLDGR